MLSKGKTELVNPVMQSDGKHDISGAQFQNAETLSGIIAWQLHGKAINKQDAAQGRTVFTVRPCAEIAGHFCRVSF